MDHMLLQLTVIVTGMQNALELETYTFRHIDCVILWSLEHSGQQLVGHFALTFGCCTMRLPALAGFGFECSIPVPSALDFDRAFLV